MQVVKLFLHKMQDLFCQIMIVAHDSDIYLKKKVENEVDNMCCTNI